MASTPTQYGSPTRSESSDLLFSPDSTPSSAVSTPTMENRKSPVWRYFLLVPGDVTTAICNICNAKVSRGKSGDESKLGTTSLMKHLEKHPDAKKVITESNRIKLQESQAKKRKIMDQYGIAESFRAQEQWNMKGDKAKAVSKLIGEMMAVDEEPFVMVERPGFIRFIHHAFPNYKLPCRKHFSEKIIESMAEGVDEALRKSPIFMGDNDYGFTTDLWTSKGHDGFVHFSS